MEKAINNESDNNSKAPEIVILIEGGIVQHIEASQEDLDVTVIDKDLDAEEMFAIQEKEVDEVFSDKKVSIKKLSSHKINS